MSRAVGVRFLVWAIVLGGGFGAEPASAQTIEAVQPSWQSIQDNVFTPMCMSCHSGPAPAAGLSLEASVSHQSLVNVASSEQPALDRVEPFNPDDSYLIRKLEGGPDITGIQMPPGSPLDQATIDAIRQWITDGAIYDGGTGCAAVRVASSNGVDKGRAFAAVAPLAIAALVLGVRRRRGG